MLASLVDVQYLSYVFKSTHESNRPLKDEVVESAANNALGVGFKKVC